MRASTSAGRRVGGFGRIVIVTLTVSLVAAGQPLFAQQRADDVTPHTCSKPSSTNLGPIVRLTLVTGPELKGRVVGQTQADSYLLCDVQVVRGTFSIPGSDGAPALINRSEVRSIESVDGLRYKNADGIDANLVRAVVELSGSERTIDVKRTDGRKMRGRITSVNQADFTITDATASTRIAYGDVMEVQRAQLHWGWKVGLISGAMVGAIALLAFLHVLANLH